MEKKRKSLWSLLNPLEWLSAIFGPILRFFGMLSPPSTEGFQNIQREDVAEAAEDAKRTEEAIDAIMQQMSPAEVVKAYASAAPEDRALMDLSALDAEGEDWLHSLREDDLTLLSMSTTAGCARSLEARAMKPIYPRQQPEAETPEILRIPSAEEVEDEKWRLIAEKFRQVQRELWLSPGVPNPEPRHVPSTLH